MPRQRLNVALPVSNPVTPPVDLLVLDRCTGADISKSPFYFLQGERSGHLKALLDGDLSVLSTLEQYKGLNLNTLLTTAKESVKKKMKAIGEELANRYVPHVERFASELAEYAEQELAAPPTFIVAVPTSRPHLIEPYIRAMRTRFPSAVEIGFARSGKWGSNSRLTVVERVRELRLKSEVDSTEGAHLLIVDDVVADGKSAAAVMMFLQQTLDPGALRFTVAAALKID